jgi:flagellar biosynthesis chaperone FliJ
MQNSVREELRPELFELRRDVKNIEEKVNMLIGQQDAIVRKLAVK